MYWRAEPCDAGLTEFAPAMVMAFKLTTADSAGLKLKAACCPEKILGEAAEAREIRPPRGRERSDNPDPGGFNE